MPGSALTDVTQLLQAWCSGDQTALEKLIPLVYDELHRLAHHYMMRERIGHTLQTTALVNEAYLRLIDATNVKWQNRAHFFAISANLMRRILVDFSRKRGHQRHEKNFPQTELSEAMVVAPERGMDLVELDNALSNLAILDPRQAKLVELRFFGGLSVDEAAHVLAVSPRTIKREWAVAKLWLLREMKRGDEI